MPGQGQGRNCNLFTLSYATSIILRIPISAEGICMHALMIVMLAVNGLVVTHATLLLS